MDTNDLMEDQPDINEAESHDALTDELLAIRAEAGAHPEAHRDTQATPESGAERDKVIEQASAERGNILKGVLTSPLVSNGLNLVPFLGGSKLLTESIASTTLDGNEVSGRSRIIHAAMGAGSLALDFTGIEDIPEGTMLAGKSVNLVGKLAASLAEKGAAKSARIFEISAKFMASNPNLTAKAETATELKIRKIIADIRDYPKSGPQIEAERAA